MRSVVLLWIPALLLAVAAGAQSLRGLQYLEDDNTHALLHAPQPRDPDSERRWREAACSPREDLTGPGRLLAMAIGEKIQKAGTRIDHVVASPSCNAVATAGLLELVPVDVEGFLASDPPEGGTVEDQRDEALVYMAGLRPSETALLVSHGRNIAELTGVETVPGEILVVEVTPLGELTVHHSVEP